MKEKKIKKKKRRQSWPPWCQSRCSQDSSAICAKSAVWRLAPLGKCSAEWPCNHTQLVISQSQIFPSQLLVCPSNSPPPPLHLGWVGVATGVGWHGERTVHQVRSEVFHEDWPERRLQKWKNSNKTLGVLGFWHPVLHCQQGGGWQSARSPRRKEENRKEGETFWVTPPLVLCKVYGETLCMQWFPALSTRRVLCYTGSCTIYDENLLWLRTHLHNEYAF